MYLLCIESNGTSCDVLNTSALTFDGSCHKLVARDYIRATRCGRFLRFVYIWNAAPFIASEPQRHLETTQRLCDNQFHLWSHEFFYLLYGNNDPLRQ